MLVMYYDTNGIPQPVDVTDGYVHVLLGGGAGSEFISTNNSITAAFDAVETFTGTADEVAGYKSIGVIIYASQLSAVDGFQAQFSANGTDWILTHSFTIPKTTGKFFNFPVEARYFRVVYVNGGLAATVQLQVIYHSTVTKESTLRLSEEVDGETAAQLGRVVIAGQIDGVFRNIKLDALTSVMPIMDVAHHEIHEGDSFTAYYSRTTAATNGHRSGLYLKTPAAPKYIHAVIQFASSTAATYSICEAPTIAANVGTHANVIYNRFRDSAITSGCFDNATAPGVNKYTTLTEVQIAADATWVTGTVIRSAPLAAGSGPKPAGGSSRDTQEYILKANTAYVFLLTNTTADANAHDILVDWYSHTTI